MDYEKLHKDTITKLQEMVNSGKITVEIARGICADFIPESEDEKIRKDIISYLKSSTAISPKTWIAWLEKQGENNMGISEATKKKLEDNLNKALEKETPKSWNEFLEKQGEQKSIDDLTPQEAMDIAVAKCFNEQKPAWSEEDDKMLKHIIRDFRDFRDCETDEELISDYDDEIKWLKSLKDRLLPYPKQEWSEADEEILNLIIARLHSHPNVDLEEYSKEYDWLNYSLKSLKDRYAWKPSDEQMKALKEAIIEMGKSASPCSIEEFHEIQSLYCNLKKLRG